MRRAFPVILLSLCALFLTCCECWPPCKTVRYEVTGVASAVSVEFNDQYGDTDKFSSIKLPWVNSFTIKYRGDEYYGGNYANGIYPAYVSAELLGDAGGTVTVAIYLDGRLLQSASSTPSNRKATAHYAIRL